MLRHIHGTVASVHEREVVLDVQGVGYLVHLLEPLAAEPGATRQLHTHLAVKEQALDLYGAETRETLALFEALLTIPKIGPKAAQNIIFRAGRRTIEHAVAHEDASSLAGISGVGAKSAAAIVSGLQNKLALSAVQDVPATASEPHPALRDAHAALQALGFSAAEAEARLAQIHGASSGADTPDTATLVRLALHANQSNP